MKKIRFGIPMVLALVIALTSGCETRFLGGVKVNSAAVQSLERGMTYQDVVSEIGEPLIHVDGERLVAYPWDTSAAHAQMNTIVLNTTDDDKSYGDTELYARYHAVCLRFDEQKRLVDWKTITANSNSNRLTAIKDWGNAPLSR